MAAAAKVAAAAAAVTGALRLPHASRPSLPIAARGVRGARGPRAGARGLCRPASSSASAEADGEGATPARLSSTAGAYVRHLEKLRASASYRREQGRVLVVGRTVIREVARALGPAEGVVVAEGAPRGDDVGVDVGDVVGRAAEAGPSPWPRVVQAAPHVLRKITGDPNPEGMVATFRFPDPSLGRGPAWLRDARRVLVLDGVQDPGNVGTLLRTALALGWDGAVVLPGVAGACDPFNDKALRAGRGAALRLPVCVAGSWAEWASGPGRAFVHVAAVAAEAPGGEVGSPAALLGPPAAMAEAEAEAEARIALVLGSEGKGLSAEASAGCDVLATVPYGGDMESLNVGVAGGILMWALQGGGQGPAAAQLLLRNNLPP